ncbi:DNA dependent ATPase [Ephemerocybe angulata]|uniref:DNA dependent ATPase n=1 Tax=Ephemerocybe angulata TaxID=980116 RepID=A0A8H6I4D0_9AGAR|nr:DNA dependent ATPase [Tulosesus angulatus]
MSRSRQNNIRGPTSALTEFLRESGITPTTIARRAAQQQPQQDEQAQGGPSTETQQNEAGPSSSRPSRTASRNRRASGYGSDNLDEDDGEPEPEQDGDDEKAEELEESPAPAKKRKLTKAAEAKLKAQEKKKKGKGKKGSDDEEYEDDDPYTSLSKSMWSSGSSKPPVGSFENCARCEKQFTVTKYTMAANPPPGWLCHVCAKASGQDPFKKPAAPRKRKAPGDKREVIHFVENRLPSLVNMCIKIVTQYIDDVESLGDIGTLNVEAIAKAMAKNRSLTPENARLFYNTTNTKLIFYDATNLTSSALESLVYMNPNLTSLRLDFCGQLDDKSFKLFITSLPALQRIELLGPFLVRSPSWKAFARAHPNLEGFLINQSPRFDLECMHALVTYCRGLKALRLREIGKMSDAFLEEIGDLGPEALTYLDLSCPSESCSDTAMVTLLSEVGGSLTHLDVSKHDLLTDTFLSEGLQHCTRLESLGMAHLLDLTDKGVADFFKSWQNPALVELDASRNPELKGDALEAIMKHSGLRLEKLNINGWENVEENGLRDIGRKGKELVKLDVGFCRNVDDFVVKAWLEGEDVKGVKKGGCRNLKELKVWGCNRVTAHCPKKHGLTLYGVESHVIRR